MKRLVIVAVVTSILFAVSLWWFSPSEVVKRRTHKLLEILAFESGGGRGARQMGVYSLNAILAPEVKLTAKSIPEANGTFERNEMESAYSWLGEQAKQTHFNLEKIHSLKIAGVDATIHFTVEALVEMPNYRPADGRYKVVFHWQKFENVWRLAEAKWDKIDGGAN